MNARKIITTFLLILPIMDIITSLLIRFCNIPLSLGAIVKTIFLCYAIIVAFNQTNISKNKYHLLYFILIILYSFFYLGTRLNGISMSQIIVELTYLLKIIYMPILLICFYNYFKTFGIDKTKITRILIINLLLYSLFLLVPLITNSGYTTYDGDYSGTIGWFYSANELSIIMVLLFPFIYSKIKNNKSIWMFLALIIILIVSTIGTKTSLIGLLIDTLLLFLLNLFDHDNIKNHFKKPIKCFLIFCFTLIIFLNSNTISNIKLNVQKQQNEIATIRKQMEKELIEAELKVLNDSNQKEDFVNIFLEKYGKALLSDRDIYFNVTYKLYKRDFNINILLFGIGYCNTERINSFAIEKLIEIDPFDILFHSGIIAFIIVILPYIYYLYMFFKEKRFNGITIYYTLILLLTLMISILSGHTLMAPAVSIYIVLYFLLAFNELGLISKKDNTIKKNKVTIYALHLNYGGVEKNIVAKANMLSEIYDVEIISLYKLNDKPVFNLNKNVKVTYLTTNIKPNRIEFKEALKNKNIIKIFKEGFYALRVLYLKHNLITKSMINCNSEIIISTRIDFTLKLVKNNEYNSIKIAEEHIYHNNNIKYLNKLEKILKRVDYLMPCSDYLTEYYKGLFTKYRYKIITNKIPIETNGTISTEKNKNIIAVGRLDKIKCFDELIKIFSKTNYKEWTLNIVGDGEECNNLKELIKDLKLKDHINLLGFKTSEELNKLYSDSSIYVMTSIEESFGLVLLEAASHGLPIIAYSSALGAKEILKDGNGVLINNRNEKEMIKCLSDLMDDLSLRKEYQKRSLNIYKKYNYDLIKDTNIKFFQNIKHNDIYSSLYKDSKNELYKLVEDRIKGKEKTFIVTANPETYMLSTKDKDINDILHGNNLIVPDGISIVKTADYLGYKIKERITGVDLSEHLLRIANKNKYKLYLFGSSESVIDKLELKIKEEYPNIKLVGATNGYIKDKDSVMNYIKTTNPDIILVALGIPLQEKLIYSHLDDFDKGIFIGVGGSFDVLSGTKKRAPKLFIKLNLEWLYRIIKEPKRIVRFMNYNIRFLKLVIEEKYNRTVDK